MNGQLMEKIIEMTITHLKIWVASSVILKIQVKSAVGFSSVVRLVDNAHCRPGCENHHVVTSECELLQRFWKAQ